MTVCPDCSVSYKKLSNSKDCPVCKLQKQILKLESWKTEHKTGYDTILLARLKEHEKDLADASGMLMVDLPEPGTKIAKLLRANRLLITEKDKAKVQIREQKEQIIKLTEKEQILCKKIRTLEDLRSKCLNCGRPADIIIHSKNVAFCKICLTEKPKENKE